MFRSLLAICLPFVLPCVAHAQWVGGGIYSNVNHFQACAFHNVDTGLFVYGANNPGPISVGTEGGIILTDDGDVSPGYYIWYEPYMNLEDIDVRMSGGRPLYMAAGHEIYGYSVVVRPYLWPEYPFGFDSVRTGSSQYYHAIRMRSDLVAFAGGADYLGNGIIDMSADTGATWTNIAILPGQPVSRLHFVDDALAFAATGGFRRLINNGIFLPDSGAIYRTTNGGSDWEQVYSDPDAGFSDVEFLDTQIGVATRNDGVILRTTDGGDSWQPAEVAWPGPYIMSSVTFRPDGMGFASCYRADGSGGYILSSEDAGASWGFNFSTAGLNNSRRIYDLYFFDDAHGFACTQMKPHITDGLVTTVARTDRETAFTVFPNPCAETVTIRGISDPNGIVELIDATGRVVLNSRNTGLANVLSLAGIPPGMYTVRASMSGISRSVPLVHY